MASKESPVLTDARRVLAQLSPILPARHEASSSPSDRPTSGPVIIGLTGLQGSGKSTWASAMVNLLQHEHNLRALTVSLDDFYRSHAELVKLRALNPNNRLLYTRGQPGTHDEQLARDLFTRLQTSLPDSSIKVPAFDKSKFNGEGDRVRVDEWPSISMPVDVVIFEGWCLGFRPLSKDHIHRKHADSSRRRAEAAFPSLNSGETLLDTLADHDLEHLYLINDNLGHYCDSFLGPEHFDCLVHLDTDDLQNVYTWRLDQEHALKARTGCGMEVDEVVRFVRGYMPAYELYLEGLREGSFSYSAQTSGPRSRIPSASGKLQVRVCLDGKRTVTEVQSI